MRRFVHMCLYFVIVFTASKVLFVLVQYFVVLILDLVFSPSSRVQLGMCCTVTFWLVSSFVSPGRGNVSHCNEKITYFLRLVVILVVLLVFLFPENCTDLADSTSQCKMYS